MNKEIILMDIFDENKNILNSQVILNNVIGFEIPKDYFFNKEFTNLNERLLLLSNMNNEIKLYYEMCSIDNYNNKIEEIKKKYTITEEYSNYRGQKIIEYESETGINVISFDGEYVNIANSKCKKYSREYYSLYYIVFSFDSKCNGNYDNLYYQKNNYCILINGFHIFKKYGKNILKFNPNELIKTVTNNSFCEYLTSNHYFDEQLNNYYMPAKVFNIVVNKIDNYVNEELDDPNMMDLVIE